MSDNFDHILIVRLLDLQERAEKQENDLNTFLRDLSILRRDIADRSKKPLYRLKNRLICRYMNHFLKNGLSFNESVVLTSSRIHEPMDRIETVYHYESQEKKIMETAAKILMIRRLVALHYPKKEIARITGYSEKYIFDLIKKNNIRSR